MRHAVPIPDRPNSMLLATGSTPLIPIAGLSQGIPAPSSRALSGAVAVAPIAGRTDAHNPMAASTGKLPDVESQHRASAGGCTKVAIVGML